MTTSATAPVEAIHGKEGSDKKRMKKKKSLVINLTHCRYDSVRRVARRSGLQPTVGEEDDWTVYWMDTSVAMERVMEMKRYQKINHFPGMGEICRKDLLGRNLSRMKKLFPRDYNIFPRTWVMPADHSEFQAFCRLKKHKTFICKPETGCQGRGIIIFKNPKTIRPGEHGVVQQYVSRPFLIDGFKFDFRVYVLVTSCDPLRVYVYKDGLGRFSTIPYREPSHHNLEEACLHLTNYSINKNSQDFVRDDVSGSKRRLSTVNQWLSDNGYDTKQIWAGIEDVIIKTLVAAHPVLRHNYRSCFSSHTHGSACFEILGFDVLLDHKLKPWLLEVNHSPSFHTDSLLDKEVKEGLLQDTFQLLDLRATDRRCCLEEDKKRAQQRLLTRHRSKDESCREEEERARYLAHVRVFEKKHMGGFRRIYPVEGGEDSDPYCRFFEQSSSLCAETAASKARMELARQQRQEIEEKVKEEERVRARLAGVGGEKREGGGDEGEVPGEEHCRPKAPLTIRRRVPFRLTSSHRPVEAAQPPAEETLPQSTVEADPEPEKIDEGEELQRLAGLQLRARLIRDLNLPQTLSFLFGCSQAPSPLPTTLQAVQPLPSSTLPPRIHSSTHHPHITLSTPQPPLSLSSAFLRPGPPAAKFGPPLRCWQTSAAPLEAFGLIVTAAPVSSRSSRHPPSFPRP